MNLDGIVKALAQRRNAGNAAGGEGVDPAQRSSGRSAHEHGKIGIRTAAHAPELLIKDHGGIHYPPYLGSRSQRLRFCTLIGLRLFLILFFLILAERNERELGASALGLSARTQRRAERIIYLAYASAHDLGKDRVRCLDNCRLASEISVELYPRPRNAVLVAFVFIEEIGRLRLAEAVNALLHISDHEKIIASCNGSNYSILHGVRILIFVNENIAEFCPVLLRNPLILQHFVCELLHIVEIYDGSIALFLRICRHECLGQGIQCAHAGAVRLGELSLLLTGKPEIRFEFIDKILYALSVPFDIIRNLLTLCLPRKPRQGVTVKLAVYIVIACGIRKIQKIRGIFMHRIKVFQPNIALIGKLLRKLIRIKVHGMYAPPEPIHQLLGG